MRVSQSRRVAAILLAWSAATPLAAQNRAALPTAPAAVPTLWGQLEAGPHPVGFRQILVRDPSRPALNAEDGRAVGTTRGRQMQISLWYPARASAAPAMHYGGYVERLGQELDFGPVTDRTRRLAIEKFMEMPAGLGGDTAALRRALPTLVALPTAARLDAAPARGLFPLVLFPEYRAPASNSVLAEYLASHGFVVASPTLKGTYDAAPETSARGIETHAADLRFVISVLDTATAVDVRRVAALGVGIAASGALALQMRMPSVQALVSLDGGITTALEIGLISATPYYDVGAVRVPMLAISAPHPSVDPARLDLYRYSTRYLVHFPKMGEFWFLNFGTLERHVPGIIGAPPGDVASGFEWGARWVRAFLDAHLRGDAQAGDAIARGTPAGANGAATRQAPESLFTFVLRPALPPPPTVAELKQTILRGGVAAIVSLVDQRRATDSQPIPSDYLAAVASWLGNSGRDRRGEVRHDLAVLRAQLYPRSARARFSLGMSANSRGDSTLARTQLADALRLLPEDADPALDAASRARLERQARDALARLGTR